MHPSFLQIGHLHISVFGVFAALGLMAALWLSQRTARHAGLGPEAAWNAGITAIVSTFVVSRMLLIAFNLRSFLAYPLLVLVLPSLTTTGVLLTAILMLGYVRWRKLPLFPLLDAAAPCAALLWAFFSLGRVLDGTHDGMPAHSIWGGGPVQPVELYALIAASLLCVALLRISRIGQVPGRTTAIALIAWGLAIFFIDFFYLPSDLLPNLWLDPAQIIGLAMILVGAALFTRARTQVKRESGNETTHAI